MPYEELDTDEMQRQILALSEENARIRALLRETLRHIDPWENITDRIAAALEGK